jgi:hypothetical protein
LENEFVISDEKPIAYEGASASLLAMESYDNEEDFEWKIIEDTILIVKYLGDKSEISIPPVIHNRSVTVIGKYAFSSGHSPVFWTKITSVKIPDTVTSIEDHAFEYNCISEINIPDSVTYIGEYAFQENELTSIKISKNISSIYEGVFSYNKLTEITIPENVNYIGKFAFSHNQLNDLYIPKSVRGIGDYAFEENKINSVTFNGNFPYINEKIFHRNEIKTLIFDNGVTEIKDGAFSRNSHITDVIIGDNVKTIGRNAFSYNQITNLIIGEKVLEIEDGAFRNNKLTELAIPRSVYRIGKNAFRDNQITSLIINERSSQIMEAAFRGNQITNVTLNLGYDYFYIFDEEVFADNPLTSIKITIESANSGFNFINPENNIQYNAFPNNFVEFLNNNNLMAGTYTYNGKSWNTDNLNPGKRRIPWSFEISE